MDVCTYRSNEVAKYSNHEEDRAGDIQENTELCPKVTQMEELDVLSSAHILKRRIFVSLLLLDICAISITVGWGNS